MVGHIAFSPVTLSVFLVLSLDGQVPQGAVKFHKAFEADGREDPTRDA